MLFLERPYHESSSLQRTDEKQNLSCFSGASNRDYINKVVFLFVGEFEDAKKRARDCWPSIIAEKQANR